MLLMVTNEEKEYVKSLLTLKHRLMLKNPFKRDFISRLTCCYLSIQFVPNEQYHDIVKQDYENFLNTKQQLKLAKEELSLNIKIRREKWKYAHSIYSSKYYLKSKKFENYCFKSNMLTKEMQMHLYYNDNMISGKIPINKNKEKEVMNYIFDVLYKGHKYSPFYMDISFVLPIEKIKLEDIISTYESILNEKNIYNDNK